MKRPSKYNTKQSEAIISYLISLKGKHTTAAQIASYFKRRVTIGLATIYRHLDTLVQNGKVNKYTLDGVSGACYQYLSGNKLNQTLLKCERCGAPRTYNVMLWIVCQNICMRNMLFDKPGKRYFMGNARIVWITKTIIENMLVQDGLE